MRPRWKTTVGVLGIIFGGFGALGASQVALMPMMLEWQRTFLAALQAQSPQEGPGQMLAGPFAEMFEQIFAPTPAWFTPWCLGMGFLMLLISGLYVFSAIWLLLLKPSAPRLFCAALVASIAASFMRVIGLVLARGVLGAAFGFGGMFGVVIDTVLLLVVLAHRNEWSHGRVHEPPVVTGASA